MRVAIVGKSAFNVPAPGERRKRIPIVLAGHTIQLIRPLAAAMIGRGWRVGHVFPNALGPEESAVTDERDTCPEGLELFPYSVGPLPKSVHDVASVAINAALIRATVRIGDLDWCLFVNPFPQLLVAQQALGLMKDGETKNAPCVAAILRGGDGYKWTDAGYVEQVLGDAIQARAIAEIYGAELGRVDLRFCASEWQKQILESRGITVDGILPSPPAPLSDRDPISCKMLLKQSLKPIWGALDPHQKWLSLVGRIHRDKTPDLAISAFSRANLAGWQMIIAGSGDTPIVEEIVNGAPDDTQGRLAIIAVPPRLLPELYGASDALIHTALPTSQFVDARPSSLTSACFAGKPVVAILSGGVGECLSQANSRELCVPYIDGCSPKDLQRLLAAKLVALQDAEAVRRIGEANRVYARTNKADLTLDNLLDQLVRKRERYVRMDFDE